MGHLEHTFGVPFIGHQTYVRHMIICTYEQLYICAYEHMCKRTYFEHLFVVQYPQVYRRIFSVLHKKDHFTTLKRESKIRLKKMHKNPGLSPCIFVNTAQKKKSIRHFVQKNFYFFVQILVDFPVWLW